MNTNNQNKPHLLLVDDERVALAIIGNGLTRAGYKVSTAESVDEAEILLADGIQPDIVILDVSMPGRDGLVLAEQLFINQVPFILLTALSDKDVVDMATKFGALGYLVKPIIVKQLIPAIEAALIRAKEISGLKTSETQLQCALNSERDVSVAVGITIVEYGIERRAAFELLRRTARSQNRKLLELSQEVIHNQEAQNKLKSSKSP
jgi:response regulator NasT